MNKRPGPMLAIGFFAIVWSGSAHAQDAAAADLAAQLRIQGVTCNAPVSATQDETRSRPDERVWLVRCADRTYRMRLIPDMAARVEPLD
jgi:hypothetical protein